MLYNKCNNFILCKDNINIYSNCYNSIEIQMIHIDIDKRSWAYFSEMLV